MPTNDRVLAVGPAGAPGVLLLHAWWGMTPAVREWADQLVAAALAHDRVIARLRTAP